MQQGCNCVLLLLKAVLSEGCGCLGRPGRSAASASAACDARVAPFIWPRYDGGPGRSNSPVGGSGESASGVDGGALLLWLTPAGARSRPCVVAVTRGRRQHSFLPAVFTGSRRD